MKTKQLRFVVLSLVLLLGLSFLYVSCLPQRSANGVNQNTTSPTIEELSAAPAKKVSYKSLGQAKEETFKYETNVFNVTFSTKGASVSSLKLKNHANADGQFVDIVYSGETAKKAFMLYWADDFQNPINDNFAYRTEGEKIIFTNSYQNAEGKEFTLVKTYEFKANEYLIKLSVEVQGEGLEEGVYAYTMSYEPQVGPEIVNPGSGRSAYGDYRRFYAGLVSKNNKAKKMAIKLAKDGSFFTTRDLNWLSLTGKYFTVIARPENEEAEYKWSARQRSYSGIAQSNSIYVSIPKSESKKSSVYFYCGPQLKKYLGSYYSGTDNEWGVRGFNLDDAMEGGSMLGWLENILKWCLMILNKIVPNYGVDIIILTIILKFLLWPLQKKSTESSAKMASISPLVEEIKAKYPNNPQKQNEEVQKLYKEKGINPMGGCLLMLIQFPILIAFYGLLNRHFELRGAMFLPGWIPDLSVPETVFTLGFRLPFLGNQIHLLPVIYTVSMIFSMKFTQMSNQNSSSMGNNQWLMTWGMPIFFFFILYGAPSGLLLYWTTQNVLSILQQIYTNNKMKKNPTGFEVVHSKTDGKTKKTTKKK